MQVPNNTQLTCIQGDNGPYNCYMAKSEHTDYLFLSCVLGAIVLAMIVNAINRKK